MAVRNPDGSVYQLGSLEIYDPANPDHELMDNVDQEVINLSGAPIEYYRIIIDGRLDDLYLEQPEKIIRSKPFCMKAVWEPVPPEISGTPFGLDSTEETIFSFNRVQFLSIVGERPHVGCLIRTCDENLWWEILQAEINIANEDRMLWGKHRYAVVCKKYVPSISDYSPSRQGRESIETGNRKDHILSLDGPGPGGGGGSAGGISISSGGGVTTAPSVTCPPSGNLSTLYKYNTTVQSSANCVSAESVSCTGSSGGTIQTTEVVYAQRVDFISEFVQYKGEALPGSSEDDAVWRIQKIEVTNDEFGDITVTWADGDANFDNIWSDHLTISFS